jgi:BlaI family transcriptional regulator, penicillinase repressor
MGKNSQTECVGPPRSPGRRHSILDLAPLELECISILWSTGEGTVRDIHQQLAVSRPRAYTTVLTIMDRLARKGVVERRKAGRAFLYHAKLSIEEARVKAVERIVEGFFSGSPEALAAHLSLHRRAIQENQATGRQPVDASGTPVAELPDVKDDERLL